MKICFRLALAAWLMSGLGGCALISLANSSPPQLFTLTGGVAAQSTASGNASDQQVSGPNLLVDEFSASAALNTSRIVYQPSPNEIQYIAGVRWADLAPVMLQTIIVERLEASGRFASVAARGAGIRGAYLLKGDIRQFATVHTANGAEARIDFFLRLVSRKDRTIVAARDFSASMPVDGTGNVAVVKAFDKALARLLDYVTPWTAEQTAAAEAASAGSFKK
jgi:cholesterol transport system auxiliary component